MIKFGPIRNIKQVNDFIKTLPRGTIKAGVVAFTEYIIGDGKHGLSKDDPYKQTTRKKVYGRTFESDKQRRYVMAAIKDGRIKIGQRNPDPTRASKGYGYKLTKGGYNATINNTEPGAYWSRVWRGWKNWRPYMKVVTDKMKGAMRAATNAANAIIRKKGK